MIDQLHDNEKHCQKQLLEMSIIEEEEKRKDKLFLQQKMQK
jgi:hypothetical protein